MFRQLIQTNQLIQTKQMAVLLVKQHPEELLALLELAWNNRDKTGLELGSPTKRSALEGKTTARQGSIFRNYVCTSPINWYHLIYAYMIENTRIYEIFRRVLNEFIHGEKLGSPSADTQQWLRNTEELFYRDPPPFSVTTLTSHIRSDLRASRRNAYLRMFGMDLNHGADDGQPYPYVKPESSNNEFVSTFEEFLREVWVAMTFVGATAAPSQTDDAKIADLATKLHNMLRARRQYGNLSREEFSFVAMMSWFHLTVEHNLPIIIDLKAETTGAEQRLFKVAQRVGLPAHALSRSMFEIAEAMSKILVEIETGAYNSAAAVFTLYTKPSNIESTMRTIITHWSIITGRDVKARKVATT